MFTFIKKNLQIWMRLSTFANECNYIYIRVSKINKNLQNKK